MLKLPVIVLNFKTYEEALGKRALKLARIADEIARKHKISIVVAPQYLDIPVIVKSVKIPVFAQHVDDVTPGAHTGHVLPESVKNAGAMGTLLNHSERKVKIEQLKKSIERCKEIGLLTVVCVPSVGKAKVVAGFTPNFIAFEPPELIGSGKSVSRMKPKAVEKFAKIVRKISKTTIPLCGAGITTAEDVRIALELGVNGVLIASAFVKSSNPRKFLRDIANEIKHEV